MNKLTVQHLGEEQLQGLADGSLRGPEGYRAGEHASACEECRADLELYRMLCERLASLRDPPVPVDFTESVLAAATVREEALQQRRQIWLAGVPAGALALFAVVGWALSMPVGRLVARTISLVEVAAQVVDVAAPVLAAARLPLGLASLALCVFVAVLLARVLRLQPAPAAARG